MTQRVAESLATLPLEVHQAWRDRLVTEAKAQGLVMYDEAKVLVPVGVEMAPWLLSRQQGRMLLRLSLAIRRVLARAVERYPEDASLRAVLPLTEEEERWRQLMFPRALPRPATVFERSDTDGDLGRDGWQRRFQFLEFNAVGVGCIHFMPVANAIAWEFLRPHLQNRFPEIQFTLPVDMRELWLRTLLDHARAIGRKRCRVALMERRETTSGGADEFSFMAQYLTSRGLTAFVADPRDLAVQDGELTCQGQPIDLIYRDYQIQELFSIEKYGTTSLEPVRLAFQRNQVVSSFLGEFDQKSVCELLTNPAYDRCLGWYESRRIRPHIPWTRLVAERKTPGPDGQPVDLVPYARGHRASLILKPNRGYGGEQVVIGPRVTDATWEAALAGAVAHPHTVVVQAYVELQQARFPALDGTRVELANQWVTLGMTPTPHGIAFLGRAARDTVVNISRGGSLVPVFLVS
ncbi:MAG: hypothetical protein HY597_06600 [Candidatus Omnitrophica bacterium]|nr:hypothetical protein [Candidatus Omnitrophota bacterium]